MIRWEPSSSVFKLLQTHSIIKVISVSSVTSSAWHPHNFIIFSFSHHHHPPPKKIRMINISRANKPKNLLGVFLLFLCFRFLVLLSERLPNLFQLNGRSQSQTTPEHFVTPCWGCWDRHARAGGRRFATCLAEVNIVAKINSLEISSTPRGTL